jgi:hypothetical protein
VQKWQHRWDEEKKTDWRIACICIEVGMSCIAINTKRADLRACSLERRWRGVVPQGQAAEDLQIGMYWDEDREGGGQKCQYLSSGPWGQT